MVSFLFSLCFVHDQCFVQIGAVDSSCTNFRHFPCYEFAHNVLRFLWLADSDIFMHRFGIGPVKLSSRLSLYLPLRFIGQPGVHVVLHVGPLASTVRTFFFDLRRLHLEQFTIHATVLGVNGVLQFRLCPLASGLLTEQVVDLLGLFLMDIDYSEVVRVELQLGSYQLVNLLLGHACQ